MTQQQVFNADRFLQGIPDGLRKPLIDSYNEIVRNFRERRWGPAELDGGKLSEIVYTILKGHTSGSFPSTPSKPKNMVAACNLLAETGDFPRSVKIQIPRLLIALYEIRNNRNVGHVGADVDPNHMDAAVVLSLAKWIMGELVRIFHGTSIEEATEIVDALADRTIPLLWKVGSRTRVLGTHLGSKDKTLAYVFGCTGAVPVKEIADSLEYKNVSQYRKWVLKPLHKADMIHFDSKSDTVEISPIGVRYVETNIALTV